MKWETAFRARQLLLEVGIRTGIDASEALTKLGHSIEHRAMQRLLSGKTKRISFDLIAAICELTGTQPADLFKLVPRGRQERAKKAVKKKTSGDASNLGREVTGPVVTSLRKARTL